MSVIRLLPLAALRLDPAFQMREEGLDPVHLDRLREAGARAVLAAAPVPVFADGRSYWTPGGFHRLEIAARDGLVEIPCAVRQGTWLDAFRFALGENDAHGLPRRPGDVRHAIRAALRLREQRRLSWTDQDVAGFCHCGWRYVKEVKAGQTQACIHARPAGSLEPPAPPDLDAALRQGEELAAAAAELRRDRIDARAGHLKRLARVVQELTKALAALRLWQACRAHVEAIRSQAWPANH